jgi:hypothetical protein
MFDFEAINRIVGTDATLELGRKYEPGIDASFKRDADR